MNSALLTAGLFAGWLLLFLGVILILAYRRVSLAVSTGVLALLLGTYWHFGAAPIWWKITLVVPAAMLLLLNIRPLRLRVLTRPFMRTYRKLLPPMSSTEREALDAGTVWWDGELFSGGPNWDKLMAAKPPRLTDTEQAFIDGPCEQLCEMLDDWTSPTGAPTCRRPCGVSSR
jgi:acyl-CoA dehydrogenase